MLNSLADVIWPVARAFAPRRAGYCSAEDLPSVTYNFKPVSQATNMPANRQHLPSTSPFVIAVTIVEEKGLRRKKQNKNKCETLPWDTMAALATDESSESVTTETLSRYIQTSTVKATFGSQSQRWIFTQLFLALSSVKLQKGHKSTINSPSVCTFFFYKFSEVIK